MTATQQQLLGSEGLMRSKYFPSTGWHPFPFIGIAWKKFRTLIIILAHNLVNLCELSLNGQNALCIASQIRLVLDDLHLNVQLTLSDESQV